MFMTLPISSVPFPIIINVQQRTIEIDKLPAGMHDNKNRERRRRDNPWGSADPNVWEEHDFCCSVIWCDVVRQYDIELIFDCILSVGILLRIQLPVNEVKNHLMRECAPSTRRVVVEIVEKSTICNFFWRRISQKFVHLYM